MKLIENMVLPRFYAIPMFLALSLKSGADAFFEVNAVKYLYIFLLVFAVFFMRTGRGYDRAVVQKSQGTSQSQLWIFIVVYFSFLILLMIFENGSPQAIFKIVSPFVFFGLVVAAADESLPFAIAVGAALNIVANAALLPFEYGWTYWGGVHTFKGFYLFKTDLAYSLATSLLVYSAWNRFKPTPTFIVLAGLSVVQVVLANSRMNYLTLALVLVYIALKNGAKPLSLLFYGTFLGAAAGAVMYFYDSSKALGFDTSNLASFTQGRDRIVEVLFKYGLANYSPTELLFGRGLYADLIIYMENISDGMPHGAHNDFLYQLVTQGVFGLILNVTGWTLVYKIANSAGRRKWAKGLAFVGFMLYISQGFSATVSLYALKTWPVATVLLLIYLYPDPVEEVEPVESKKPRRSTAVSLV
ncbi:MAG TPA: hypothetical protein VFW93_03315 [Aquabacterium sp.]|uniref:hypothetical protein n=1 Tax=Aquabacterium sp. TaxID=1872578 RepID=UPI002E37EF25|nr:hypothetical protein [Aquabacterium sp.]HEX5355221.1 hypothetical protein [Aquabacterium sp.]